MMNPKDIERLRSELGWSLAEFGRYLGVSAQAVLKWEKGTAKPNQLAVAAMLQLQRKLKVAKEENQKQKFINGLRQALFTGGLIALLAYLFNQDEEL